MKENILYKIKTASEQEIYSHLVKCNNSFIPPLSEKVRINEYAKKIFEKAVVFEAWANNVLVGCIAAYFNDEINHLGYITNVSVINEYIGFGIATKLLNMCIEYAKQNSISEISLEVNKNSRSAIHLYTKFSFRNINCKENNMIMKLTL
jgi:ribosomal protein S18 acetylase RimI-like enzyme